MTRLLHCERAHYREGLRRQPDFDAIDAEITAIVADALTFAMESPFPEPDTATLHIYSDQG